MTLRAKEKLEIFQMPLMWGCRQYFLTRALGDRVVDAGIEFSPSADYSSRASVRSDFGMDVVKKGSWQPTPFVRG
jgi:hypothetical protein